MQNTTTTPPQAASTVIALPEFCDGKQLRSLFGLSRSHAYVLASEGKIRAVSIRRPGAVRGKRLWHCESIRAFLKMSIEEAK